MLRRALLLVTALAACGGPPQVEVLTRAGPPPPEAEALTAALDTWRARLAALTERHLDAALADLPDDDARPAPRRRPPRAAAPAPAEAAPEDRTEAPGPARQLPAGPPRAADELAALVAAVREAPLSDLGPAARALADADPALWPELRELLLAPRKARKADYKALLGLVGGDVPNRYGHFELAWKRAHGHAVRLSEDWFEDLLALPSGQVSKALRPIYRDCVLQSALLRAAAAIGQRPGRTADVVDALLEAAYAHEGTFRDEVGRAIRRLGDPAIPTLLRRSVRPRLPADEKEAQEIRDSVAYRQAEYAMIQVDRMDRAHPRKAIEAVRDDPRRLADLFAAYGAVRLDEAAAPLLDHADAPLPRVRSAAREAFLAYVTGPAPRPERKLLRLLGGGTSEGPARLTYRDMARIAIRERLADLHPDLVEPECRLVRKDGTIDRDCERQPERLTRAYFARLDEDRRAHEQAQISAALAVDDRDVSVAMLDALLADDPDLVARAELVPTYETAAAEALAAGDPARAARLLRKSAALLAAADPARAQALRVRALLHEAELARTPEGRDMLRATAERLAPGDPAVQRAAGGGAGRPGDAVDLPRRAGTVAAAAAGLLAALLALGSYRARRS